MSAGIYLRCERDKSSHSRHRRLFVHPFRSPSIKLGTVYTRSSRAVVNGVVVCFLDVFLAPALPATRVSILPCVFVSAFILYCLKIQRLHYF